MSYLQTRKALLLIKEESSEGVDASPTPADNAILAEVSLPQFNLQTQETNEASGSFDGFGDLVGGMNVNLPISVFLKGSGSAGTAPEWGQLMKSCGYAEDVTATAVPAAAEALGGTGTTTTAILGSSAGSADDAYNGMPIELSTTLDETSFILDYVGSTKTATLTDTLAAASDATSDYQIPANVRYTPASAAVPSSTIYMYLDGLLYKFLGARGTVELNQPTGNAGRLNFTMSCMFDSYSDASLPTNEVVDLTRPGVFKNGVFKIDRAATAINSFTLNTAANLTFPGNPNATQGFDPAQYVGRKIEGTMDPALTLKATRAIVDDMLAGTRKSMHLRYGSTAGNRVGITVPDALYKGANPQDDGGITRESVSFQAVGQDSGFHLCLY